MALPEWLSTEVVHTRGPAEGGLLNRPVDPIYFPTASTKCGDCGTSSGAANSSKLCPARSSNWIQRIFQIPTKLEKFRKADPRQTQVFRRFSNSHRPKPPPVMKIRLGAARSRLRVSCCPGPDAIFERTNRACPGTSNLSRPLPCHKLGVTVCCIGEGRFRKACRNLHVTVSQALEMKKGLGMEDPTYADMCVRSLHQACY